MPEIRPTPPDLANGDHDDSEETEDTEALRYDAHNVEHFRNDNHAGIESIENIEQKHHVACKGFHNDLNEKQGQENIVYLGKQCVRYIKYVSNSKLKEDINSVY